MHFKVKQKVKETIKNTIVEKAYTNKKALLERMLENFAIGMNCI